MLFSSIERINVKLSLNDISALKLMSPFKVCFLPVKRLTNLTSLILYPKPKMYSIPFTSVKVLLLRFKNVCFENQNLDLSWNKSFLLLIGDIYIHLEEHLSQITNRYLLDHLIALSTLN